MKIRNGFVSNSSSSSFIVAFPHDPQSTEDVREILFKGVSMVGDYTSGEIAGQVYKDILTRNGRYIHDVLDITETLARGWYIWDTYSAKKEYDELVKSSNWKEFHLRSIERALDAAASFMRQNPDGAIYIFRYSDEDGNFFSTMEHGNIFNSVPHIRSSEH